MGLALIAGNSHAYMQVCQTEVQPVFPRSARQISSAAVNPHIHYQAVQRASHDLPCAGRTTPGLIPDAIRCENLVAAAFPSHLRCCFVRNNACSGTAQLLAQANGPGLKHASDGSSGDECVWILLIWSVVIEGGGWATVPVECLALAFGR